MKAKLKCIEYACRELREYLQIDDADLRWIRSVMLHIIEEYEFITTPIEQFMSIEQTVECIEQVVRQLLTEGIEIGDSATDSTKFVIWRGSVDERVRRARPLIEEYEKILRKSMDEINEELDYYALRNDYAFAFWLRQ